MGTYSSTLPFVLFGTIHALACSLWGGSAAFGKAVESVAIAHSVADTGTFANPYAPLPTGLTAHMAPLYPLYLGLLMHGFGNMFTVAWLATLINAALYGILVALLIPAGSVLFSDRRIGRAAAWLAIAIPSHSMSPQGESIPFALGLLLFALQLLGGYQSAPVGVASGLTAGIVMLLNPAGSLLMTAWVLGAKALGWISWRTCCVVAGLGLGLILPWMLRNYLLLGTFAVRDNFGSEIRIHNNDFAGATYGTSKRAMAHYSPSWSIERTRAVSALGEVEYNRRCFEDALAWIHSHPQRFLWLTIKRVALFWFPAFGSVQNYGTCLLTLLSIPSMLWALRQPKRPAFLLLAGLLLFSLPYALVSADLRLRTPVLWITILFAADTLLSARRKWTIQTTQ